MRLHEIMTPKVVCIGPAEAAETAWSRMEREGIRHLVVMEGPRLSGVLSQRDLGGRRGGALRRGRTVRDFMTAMPHVATARSTTTLRQAANLMRGRLIGCLPVVDDGRLVGIVTATDVLDELGRGSSRPEIRAKRRPMRVPPAPARAGRRKGARTRRAKTRSVRVRGKSRPAQPNARVGMAAPAGRLHAALGRDRVRTPDSPKRAPFAKRVARQEKRTAGRTVATETPAWIRAVGPVLDAADRSYMRRKLGRKLGKFAPAIERASVRVDDINGPRGGVDKRCRLKIVLSGRPSVVVEERHHAVKAALDGALARAERAVRRNLQRRRMKPLRGSRATTSGSSKVGWPGGQKRGFGGKRKEKGEIEP